MSAGPARAAAQKVEAGLLGELRALKHAGFAGASARVRRMAHAVPDALTAEAVGALLSGDRARAELEADGARAVSLAVLGSSTLDALPHLVRTALTGEGLVPRIATAGYNQWRFALADGAPELAAASPRIVALLLDDQAVFEEIANPVDLDEVAARCDAFPAILAAWADQCREALGGLTVLCTVPLCVRRRDRLVDFAGRARLSTAWHRMNARICELAADRPGIVVLDAAALGAAAGAVEAPDRLRHIASQAFDLEFLWAYAGELARVVRADLGAARKCLVLDLDDTLWGGVAADDGLGGIKIGGGYPGSAFRELQEAARDLAAQGVVLAVASKNDEAVVREVFAVHPDMVLRADSVVAVRADWEPKPDNLRRLAEQLNLGLDAFVFVDDSPVERGLMRELAPEVATVEVPADPAERTGGLLARGDFAVLRLTEEDRRRTERYQSRGLRDEAAASAADLGEYLAGLGTWLAVEPLSPLNRDRIAQLFGKTNQFNLTGLRYSEQQIARLQEQDSTRFFGARVGDRFGDSGLAAAIAVGRDGPDWVIENFVLSCRVFGRDVESAVATLLLRAAATAGAAGVRAEFWPTDKNAKFAGFYPRLGFARPAQSGSAESERTGTESGSAASGVRYRHDLRTLPEPPAWITINREEAFHAC